PGERALAGSGLAPLPGWGSTHPEAGGACMRSRIALFALALVLGAATLASAQVAVESGTVVRIDPQSSVVMLEDGRMYRVTPSTVFMIDNRPAAFATLRSGDRVVIQSADPVVYRDGQYTVVTPRSAVVAQAPPPVIAQAPPPPAPVAVPVGVRQTLYG